MDERYGRHGDLGNSHDETRCEPVALGIGGLSRPDLLAALRSAGVALNAYAEALFAHPAFDDDAREQICVVERTVADLGFSDGATLPEIYAAAEKCGLSLCPAVTAPYLRLAWETQANSSDSVLSAGRSPDGAVYVASPAFSNDVDGPRGFYLRVVDGQRWLRGYRCDDLYGLAPAVRFIFRQWAES